MSADDDLQILFYNHRIQKSGIIFFFVFANIVIPLFVAGFNYLDRSSTKLEDLFRPPSDQTIAMYFIFVFISIIGNAIIIVSTIQSYKGFSEFRYNELRERLIYREWRKADISISLDLLLQFELKWMNDNDWILNAVLKNNVKIKIKRDRSISRIIALLIAEKLELEINFVNVPKGRNVIT